MTSVDRTHRVVAQRGVLHVGEWHPDADGLPWLLVHGVTASHLAWSWVAAEAVDVRLIAPDLWGRGLSAQTVHEPSTPEQHGREPHDDVDRASLSPTGPTSPTEHGPSQPTGLAAHADDLIAVLDALGIPRAVVVGHSMGAFIAAVLADRHPDRIARVVLVDGGLPLDLPAGLHPRAAVRHVLGPTAARLDMRFESVAAYRDFWRAHPAFAGREDPLLDAYFAYDLVGEEPHLRPATSFATVEADSIDQNTGAAIARALERMPRPTTLLAAERGLRGEVPPLYPDLGILAARFPGLGVAERVADVDHYSIVMSPEGARAVVRAVEG